MKRKTITLEDELYETVQKYRAKRIREGKNMSFSEAVRELLKKGIKKIRRNGKIGEKDEDR